jgi:hypothetical protein
MRTFLQQKVHEKNHQKCVTKVETFLQQNMVFMWFLYGFSHGRKCAASITFVWIFSSVVVRQLTIPAFTFILNAQMAPLHSRMSAAPRQIFDSLQMGRIFSGICRNASYELQIGFHGSTIARSMPTMQLFFVKCPTCHVRPPCLPYLEIQ